MSYDVVIIGAGVAGMVVARRAQQLGGQAIVIDKAPDLKAGLDPGSNTRKSGGLFHAAYRDPRRWSPDELYGNLMAKTDGQTRPEVARAWADNVLRGLQFLASEGARLERDGELEFQWNAIVPPMTLFYDVAWRGRGPDLLLDRMRQAFEAAGGTMGGLQGGPRNGYSGGWSEATTFGLLAAEHAMSVISVSV